MTFFFLSNFHPFNRTWFSMTSISTHGSDITHFNIMTWFQIKRCCHLIKAKSGSKKTYLSHYEDTKHLLFCQGSKNSKKKKIHFRMKVKKKIHFRMEVKKNKIDKGTKGSLKGSISHHIDMLPLIYYRSI